MGCKIRSILTPPSFFRGGERNPEHVHPLCLLFPLRFWFISGIQPTLKQETNGWKTKTHESDQTVITVTRERQRHQEYCPQFGDQQEYGKDIPWIT